MYVCGHVCFQSLRKLGKHQLSCGSWHSTTGPLEEQLGLLRAVPSLQPVIASLVWNVTCQSIEGSVDAPVSKSSCHSSRESEFSTQHSCPAAHSCYNSSARESETLFLRGTCSTHSVRVRAHTQSWEQKSWSSTGKNILISCSVPNGHP